LRGQALRVGRDARVTRIPLTPGVPHIEHLHRDDPERVVDQISDERRVSLRRLGRELGELEREAEAFRARAAAREQQRLTEVRAAAKQARIPVRGRRTTIAWLTETDYDVARHRWAGWVNSFNQNEPFDERRVRMERRLRERRADGDGPFVVVTIDLDRYATWCEEQGHEPADRRSRATFVQREREKHAGRQWPPGRNEPCWCGSGRKYKRCCGALQMHTIARSTA